MKKSTLTLDQSNKIDNLSQVISAAITCLRKSINVIFVSPPGMGKSVVTENTIAKELNAELLIYHPAMGNPVHIMGLPFKLNEEKADFLPLGFMEKLFHAKKPLLLLIDDVGQASPIMQAAMMQLVQSRCINNRKISDKVMFILCTNDAGQGSGVSKILEPLKSRTVIFNFNIPVNNWINYNEDKNNPWHNIFSQYFKLYPEKADQWEITHKCENTANRRNWTRFSDLFNEYDDESLTALFAEGCLGKSICDHFISFFRTYKKVLPLYKSLLNNNANSAELVDTDEELLALASAIMNKIDNNNFILFTNYLNRYTTKRELIRYILENIAKKVPNYKNSAQFTKLILEGK